MSKLIRRTGAEVERRPLEKAVELAATAHRKVVVKRQELRVALSIAARTRLPGTSEPTPGTGHGRTR
ncbi:hypothetical protein [Amycolatopsis sp. NPDC050768]|uniref:hypothetical protein n=1 Tax=Amycolatopsis sp. NPDC050768 TaxID=3154839 RepID=UPI0034101163